MVATKLGKKVQPFKTFHRLIMGNMKIGFNYCLIAVILTELF